MFFKHVCVAYGLGWGVELLEKIALTFLVFNNMSVCSICSTGSPVITESIGFIYYGHYKDAQCFSHSTTE